MSQEAISSFFKYVERFSTNQHSTDSRAMGPDQDTTSGHREGGKVEGEWRVGDRRGVLGVVRGGGETISLRYR